LKWSDYSTTAIVLVFRAGGEDGQFADMSEPDGRRRLLLFHLQELRYVNKEELGQFYRSGARADTRMKDGRAAHFIPGIRFSGVNSSSHSPVNRKNVHRTAANLIRQNATKPFSASYWVDWGLISGTVKTSNQNLVSSFQNNTAQPCYKQQILQTSCFFNPRDHEGGLLQKLWNNGFIVSFGYEIKPLGVSQQPHRPQPAVQPHAWGQLESRGPKERTQSFSFWATSYWSRRWPSHEPSHCWVIFVCAGIFRRNTEGSTNTTKVSPPQQTRRFTFLLRLMADFGSNV
ncbi:hypothetical protein GOODEAATRI_005566, partial [Goodea atripinnis]